MAAGVAFQPQREPFPSELKARLILCFKFSSAASLKGLKLIKLISLTNTLKPVSIQMRRAPPGSLPAQEMDTSCPDLCKLIFHF